MGVGRIPGFDDAIAHSYTTSLDTGDFTKRAANTAGFNFHVPQPIVLVVKKKFISIEEPPRLVKNSHNRWENCQ